MYTEENEFDYNAYLDENNDNQDSGNSFFNKRLIMKIVLILLCLILIIFLFFTIKNNFKKDEKTDEIEVDSNLVFNDNIAMLKGIAEKYFFEMKNHPTKKGENITLNVKELIDGKLITEVLDYDKKACGYNTSYISMTRNQKDYMLEIYLNCPSNEEKRVYYYDLEFNCLTCKGEAYISSDDEEDDTSNSNQNSDDTTNNDTNDNNTSLVCKEFGEWTNEYKNDNSLDVETRVVVKGYKSVTVYGNWSPETTIPVQANSNLQVRVVTRNEPTTTVSAWSSATTTKPATKEGRYIKSWSESVPYTTESCSNKVYTQNRSTWDNTAERCTTTGIGKVTCTYVKKVCDKVKKYKNVTYYQYQDTITTYKNVTYYQSRTISQNVDYTDYILESEMPAGYTKLNGSEITQYRYRPKCEK